MPMVSMLGDFLQGFAPFLIPTSHWITAGWGGALLTIVVHHLSVQIQITIAEVRSSTGKAS